MEISSNVLCILIYSQCGNFLNFLLNREIIGMILLLGYLLIHSQETLGFVVTTSVIVLGF